MHTFKITHTVRMNDADWYGTPCTVEVEAWDLHEALLKAADLPFGVLMADMFKEGVDE